MAEPNPHNYEVGGSNTPFPSFLLNSVSFKHVTRSHVSETLLIILEKGCLSMRLCGKTSFVVVGWTAVEAQRLSVHLITEKLRV